MPATGAERVACHRRRQRDRIVELETEVAELRAEHADCRPTLLARAEDLRRRAVEIEDRAT